MVSTRLSSSISNSTAAATAAAAATSNIELYRHHNVNDIPVPLIALPIRCMRNTNNSVNAVLSVVETVTAAASSSLHEPSTSTGSGTNHHAVNAQASTSKMVAPTPITPPTYLMDLPLEMLEKILNYLPFKQVSHMRIISRKMDQVCGTVLNSSFQKLQVLMFNRFHAIKVKMPRRESARRNHPLATECDIVETLHMRLCLLQMTFGKHIERKHCCFFAGEVLDEVNRILHFIKTTPKLPKPYKVTDELFDLSSMAMEYFREKIEPNLPDIGIFSADFMDFSPYSPCNKDFLLMDSVGAGNTDDKRNDRDTIANAIDCVDNYRRDPVPQSNMVLRKRIIKIKQGMKKYNNQLHVLKQDLRTCKRKSSEQQKQSGEQQRQLAEQQKQMLEYATRLDENDKKNEEMSRKFSTLLQELNKCKTELQYWRSKSPAIAPKCAECSALCANALQEDIKVLANQGVKLDGMMVNEDNSDIDVNEGAKKRENTEKHNAKHDEGAKIDGYTSISLKNSEAKTLENTKGHASNTNTKPLSPGPSQHEVTNETTTHKPLGKRKVSSSQAPPTTGDDTTINEAAMTHTTKKTSKREAAIRAVSLFGGGGNTNQQQQLGVGTNGGATTTSSHSIVSRGKRAKFSSG